MHRAWMHAVPRESGPPALREALYGRIELCTLEDLPELIRIAHEEASIATDMYSEASVEIKKHLEDERAKDTDRDALTDRDYLRMVREVLLHVSPLHWSARQSLMEESERHLRKVATLAGIPFEEPKLLRCPEIPSTLSERVVDFLLCHAQDAWHSPTSLSPSCLAGMATGKHTPPGLILTRR